MDISPLPRNPLHPPGQLRLLEPVVYDGGDFATYPERQDWGPRTAVEWVCLFDEPPTEFSALLERWILFGPLSVALSLLQNPPFTLAEFIREIPSDEPTAGRAVFDTQHLVQLLADIALLREDWVASINALSGDATMDVRIMSLTSMILLARRLSQQLLPAPRTYKDDMSFGNERPLTLVTFLSRYTMRDPRGPGVATATSMVLEMLLGDPRVDRQGNSPGDTMNKEKSGRSMQRRSSELWTRFRQAGWCPAELLRLWAKFDTCSLHYLYNMPRPRPDEHHETAGPNEYFGPGGDGDPPKPKSQYCTIFRCAHRQLQDATYQRAHAEGCNGCGDAVADQAELADILERGSIPLILSVADDDDDESMVNITLVGAEPDMSYVAISHVWSDGLGNVDCNAIPLCQLRRLSKMIRNLPGANADMLLFWLDTICVPPDSARMDRAQRLALSKMRNVYQDATTVLVLDSWLFHGGAAQDMSDAEKIVWGNL
ncbi:hypothetical protein S40288_10290 [Stachybotrys chartarum IBT 40288]|nr:hypothetical protein S40288_10290 [Stachybotrys chartarum IBT 40288]